MQLIILLLNIWWTENYITLYRVCFCVISTTAAVSKFSKASEADTTATVQWRGGNQVMKVLTMSHTKHAL